MALDQLTYIRCVQGPDAAVVEVSEKDLIDRVSIYCLWSDTKILSELE